MNDTRFPFITGDDSPEGDPDAVWIEEAGPPGGYLIHLPAAPEGDTVEGATIPGEPTCVVHDYGRGGQLEIVATMGPGDPAIRRTIRATRALWKDDRTIWADDIVLEDVSV